MSLFIEVSCSLCHNDFMGLPENSVNPVCPSCKMSEKNEEASDDACEGAIVKMTAAIKKEFCDSEES
jgi:hypothetical protein